MTDWMIDPSAEDVRTALDQNADSEDGGWRFHAHPQWRYSDGEAYAMTRANLILGLPITGSLSANAYLRIAERLADLDARMRVLEPGRD